MSMRHLKQQVSALLQTLPFEESMAAVAAMPARQVINPLFSLLYHDQPIIRWRAVSAFGVVVGQLADHNVESARVIVRRLMWSLNDESGGIGWGSPEAMGEILVRHAQLAREYASILVSYLNPEGNYLEHEQLRLGGVWAVGRLARVRPRLVVDAAAFLAACFGSTDAQMRGLALWAFAPIADDAHRPLIEPLRRDPAQFTLYRQGELVVLSVARAAGEALGG
jgi:hypothetical protein